MGDPTSDQDLLGTCEAAQKPEIPRLYMNGFSVGSSLSDMYVLAHTAGTPSALLLMSFTTAKTLAQRLSEMIADFEKMTGQTLLTMDDIRRVTEPESETTT